MKRMKFSSALAFNKHLKEAAPHHLAPIFLVVSPSDYERRQVIDQIGKVVKADRVVRMSGLVETVAEVREELSSPSLWGGVTVVVYESADKVKNLADLFLHLPPQTHLIIGAASFKPLSELYQKGKKEIVALDLSDEKPWEKERRLQEWLVGKAQESQKVLHSNSAAFLVQALGVDLAVLDQELAKLICFVGDKEHLELSDIKVICGTRDLLTGWQLSEELVWEKPISLQGQLLDLGFIFPFIGQLRYQFQLGYQIAELAQKKRPISEIKHQFPTVRQIDKYAQIAALRKTSFFSRGLQALYELEFASKSSGLDIGALFDLFQAKIYEKTLSPS